MSTPTTAWQTVTATLTQTNSAPTDPATRDYVIVITESPKTVNLAAIVPSIIIPFLVIIVLLSALYWGLFKFNKNFQYLIGAGRGDAPFHERPSTELRYFTIGAWLSAKYDLIKRVGHVGEENGAMPGGRYWRQTEEGKENERRREEDERFFGRQRRSVGSFFSRKSTNWESPTSPKNPAFSFMEWNAHDRAQQENKQPKSPTSSTFSERTASFLWRRASKEDLSIGSPTSSTRTSLFKRLTTLVTTQKRPDLATSGEIPMRFPTDKYYVPESPVVPFCSFDSYDEATAQFYRHAGQSAQGDSMISNNPACAKKSHILSLRLNYSCEKCCKSASYPTSSLRSSIRVFSSYLFGRRSSNATDEEVVSTAQTTPNEELKAVVIIPTHQRDFIGQEEVSTETADSLLDLEFNNMLPSPASKFPYSNSNKNKWKRQDRYCPSSTIFNRNHDIDTASLSSGIPNNSGIIPLELEDFLLTRPQSFVANYTRSPQREPFLLQPSGVAPREHEDSPRPRPQLRKKSVSFVNDTLNNRSYSMESGNSANLKKRIILNIYVPDASGFVGVAIERSNTFPSDKSSTSDSSSIASSEPVEGFDNEPGILTHTRFDTVRYIGKNYYSSSAMLRGPVEASPRPVLKNKHGEIYYSPDLDLTPSDTESFTEVNLKEFEKSVHTGGRRSNAVNERSRDSMFGMKRMSAMSGYSVYTDARSTFSRASVYTEALEDQD